MPPVQRQRQPSPSGPWRNMASRATTSDFHPHITRQTRQFARWSGPGCSCQNRRVHGVHHRGKNRSSASETRWFSPPCQNRRQRRSARRADCPAPAVCIMTSSSTSSPAAFSGIWPEVNKSSRPPPRLGRRDAMGLRGVGAHDVHESSKKSARKPVSTADRQTGIYGQPGGKFGLKAGWQWNALWLVPSRYCQRRALLHESATATIR